MSRELLQQALDALDESGYPGLEYEAARAALKGEAG